MKMKECYGTYKKWSPRCKGCDLAAWCATAGDPPRVADGNRGALYKHKPLATATRTAGATPTYSEADLLKIIRYLCSMPYRDYELICAYVQAGDDFKGNLGAARVLGVTRQAVQERVVRLMRRCPELAILLGKGRRKQWKS